MLLSECYSVGMERVYTLIDAVYDQTVGSVIRTLTHATTQEVILLPSAQDSDSSSSAPEQHTFKTVSELIEKRVTTESLSNSVAYVGSTRVPLFSAPTREFDTVLTHLPYGAMVMVLEDRGRFSRVMVNEREGWVLRDDLSDRAAYVYPEFIIGEENDADDPNTLRVRACIMDEFSGSEAETPLQAGEYVTYKLMRKGKTITWPSTRPRTPGRWHQILRGAEGIHNGINPKSGSIMECTFASDIGHLAYVEAVFPDETITISEVNYPDRGIYNERTLTKEEWQGLNPVFIGVG